VTVAVTPEHTVDLGENLLERHVLRVHGHNRCLTPQIPQEPLLPKAPPGPSQDPVLNGLNEADPRFDATALACHACAATAMLPVLDLAERDDEILPDPAEHASGGDYVGELSIARYFAIQLVPSPTGRDHEHIHLY
jgi:hypothetical protein